MLVRGPQDWASARRRENVNTLDLFPTLCEAAGLPAPTDLDGRSLLPLLEAQPSHWIDETFSQYTTDEFMLKRGNLKYLTFGAKGPDVLLTSSMGLLDSVYGLWLF